MRKLTWLGLVAILSLHAGCPDTSKPECQVLATSYSQSTTLEKGCYLAKATPILSAGVKLTLKPGVKITFSKDVGLEFIGTQALVAVGTAADPILLTGAQQQRGFWVGLTFAGDTSPDSRLDYVTVEYAGSTTAYNDSNAAAVKLTSDSTPITLALSNSTLRESQGWGLWLASSAQIPGFAGNIFTQNTLGPVNLDSETARGLDAASSYKGNDVDLVRVRANRIDTTGTWAAIDVPFYIDASLDVMAEWTLAAPNTLVMAKDSALTISDPTGALVAQGTATSPILITAEVKTRGFWGSLVFENTNNAKNAMDYVTVEYAGGGQYQDSTANVVLTATTVTPNTTHLAMSHCTLRESQGYGLAISAAADLTGMQGNVFSHNTLGAALANSEVVHQLVPSSTFTGNDTEQIAVLANRALQSVTWADLGVPYVLSAGMHVDKVLTLAPGVTVVMAQDGGLWLAGDEAGLHAVGTAEKPITLTGATKTAGFWRAIEFDNSNNSQTSFDYVTVEYGGKTDTGDAAMIHATSDSHGVTISVTRSAIQHSASAGIYLSRWASFNADIETSNTFSDCAGGSVLRQN
jgi:hypothetical protein